MIDASTTLKPFTPRTLKRNNGNMTIFSDRIHPIYGTVSRPASYYNFQLLTQMFQTMILFKIL